MACLKSIPTPAATVFRQIEPAREAPPTTNAEVLRSCGLRDKAGSVERGSSPGWLGRRGMAMLSNREGTMIDAQPQNLESAAPRQKKICRASGGSLCSLSKHWPSSHDGGTGRNDRRQDRSPIHDHHHNTWKTQNREPGNCPQPRDKQPYPD